MTYKTVILEPVTHIGLPMAEGGLFLKKLKISETEGFHGFKISCTTPDDHLGFV